MVTPRRRPCLRLIVREELLAPRLLKGLLLPPQPHVLEIALPASLRILQHEGLPLRFRLRAQPLQVGGGNLCACLEHGLGGGHGARLQLRQRRLHAQRLVREPRASRREILLLALQLGELLVLLPLPELELGGLGEAFGRAQLDARLQLHRAVRRQLRLEHLLMHLRLCALLLEAQGRALRGFLSRPPLFGALSGLARDLGAQLRHAQPDHVVRQRRQPLAQRVDSVLVERPGDRTPRLLALGEHLPVQNGALTEFVAVGVELGLRVERHATEIAHGHHPLV